MNGSFTRLSQVSTTTRVDDIQLTMPLGYGQTGPYRRAAGYDVVIEGEAGLMHM